MKYLTSVLSFFILTAAFAEDTEWQIIKNSPFMSYSAEFLFKKGDVSDGKVIRTGFMCPRYYYDVYDDVGYFKARGITRFFSVGFIAPSAMDIDVYDGDNYLGLIQGKVFTRTIKFTFFNQLDQLVATAFLDARSADILIVENNNVEKIIAKISGESFGDYGFLKVAFEALNENIDERILKVFGAFISDYHQRFTPTLTNSSNALAETVGFTIGVLDGILRSKNN
ncbi:MAG: hypothetical protein JXA94_01975 [Parachlamydiales bacterium]|nr:hypothetical protein [Parachlamydiales bacterium]